MCALGQSHPVAMACLMITAMGLAFRFSMPSRFSFLLLNEKFCLLLFKFNNDLFNSLCFISDLFKEGI
jgi:hypothetical protein